MVPRALTLPPCVDVHIRPSCSNRLRRPFVQDPLATKRSALYPVDGYGIVFRMAISAVPSKNAECYCGDGDPKDSHRRCISGDLSFTTSSAHLASLTLRVVSPLPRKRLEMQKFPVIRASCRREPLQGLCLLTNSLAASIYTSSMLCGGKEVYL